MEKTGVYIGTQAQYPKKICLSLWGDKVDQFRVAEGEIVNVSVDLESREYNGRWYTEARAWKLEKSNGSGAPMPPMGDEPFENSAGGATDDLPF